MNTYQKLFALTLGLGIGAQTAEAGPYSYGINSLNSPATYSKLKDELGVTSVKIWVSMVWGSSIPDWIKKDLDKAVAAKAKGLHVTVTLSASGGKHPANSDAVKSYIRALMNYPGLRGAVDIWEVGNEIDHSDEYWQGRDEKLFVSKVLKPAFEVLSGEFGEKVASPSPAWDLNTIRNMISVGMLDYSHYIGFHAYRESPSALESAFAELKTIVGSRPIVVTEWICRGKKKWDAIYNTNKNAPVPEDMKREWAACNKAMYPIIAKHSYAAYYFGDVFMVSMAGRASIYKNSGGTPAEPFYTSFKQMKTGGAGTDGGGNQPPQPPTPPTTNLPQVGQVTLINVTKQLAVPGFLILGASEIVDVAAVKKNQGSFSQFALEADLGSGAKSLTFEYAGSKRVETNLPLASFGDDTSTGNFYGKSVTAASHKIIITPYSGTGGTGTKGTPKTITVTFKNVN